MTVREAQRILGLPEAPTDTDEYRIRVRAAWRALAKTLHPDRNRTAGAATAFKAAQVAQHVLVGASRGELDEEAEAEEPAADETLALVFSALQQIRAILAQHRAALLEFGEDMESLDNDLQRLWARQETLDQRLRAVEARQAQAPPQAPPRALPKPRAPLGPTVGQTAKNLTHVLDSLDTLLKLAKKHRPT